MIPALHPNFAAFQVAVAVYNRVGTLTVPSHLRDQLLSASSSVVLNLAEGSGRSGADSRRCYRIAFGSHREVQAILLLVGKIPDDLALTVHRLGGLLFGLCRPKPG